AAAADLSYSAVAVLKNEGSHSAVLDGKDDYLLLPASLGSLKQLTLTAWVNQSNLTTAWARLFDFGNDEDHYFFVTLNSGSDARLVLKNGGSEQILSVGVPSAGWHYVTVTLSDESVSFYLDGKLAGTSTDITLRPSDLKTVRNYIGRSQYSADPLFKGYIDDLRIYDFALTADEVALLYAGEEISAIETVEAAGTLAPACYDLTGRRVGRNSHGLIICDGKLKLYK
ncbi:MAG: LamG domain-containing protein, partial [Bacteroidales bacterium]|nr:LamG domain-containing protein [Bacteroidales bacterium]